MKSIRLSLLIYFLVLLAMALGAVSVLAYRETERALAAKETIVQEQYKKQYADACRNEQRKFDRALLGQARTFGLQAQDQFHRSRRETATILPASLLCGGSISGICSRLISPLAISPMSLLAAGLDRNTVPTSPMLLGSRFSGSWLDILYRGLKRQPNPTAPASESAR